MRLQRDSYAPKSCAFDAANVQFLRAHLCKSHPVLQQLPSRKLMASVISCSSATIDQIIRDWIARDLFMHSSGALWMRRTELLDHWVWLKPFLQMQKDIEQSVAIPDTMVMPEVER